MRSGKSSPAKKIKLRRNELVEQIAAHMLAEGLGETSLRAIAKAISTSDRMLLYYFKDKADLLETVLAAIAQQLASILAAARSDSKPQAYTALFKEMWGAIQTPSVLPYIKLWIELSAAAVRHREPKARAANQIADLFLDWTESRLAPRPGLSRRHQATLLMGTIDGLAMLFAVGKEREANLAAALSSKLEH
jgi:AcrR family transcriptional regulator